jgi:hypothetical protein
MRRDMMDLMQYYAGLFRAVDGVGREIQHIGWIDEEAGTYSQYLIDDDGWTNGELITRIGKLYLKKVSNADR